MPYTLMWSAVDKAAIQKELDDLRQLGHVVEVSRVVAYLHSVAMTGASSAGQNVHMNVGPRTLYSACPFGKVGVFYAYDARTSQICILAFCLDRFKHVPIAAARLANVP